VAAALLAVLLALGVFAPEFYQAQPLLSLLTRVAPTLVVACGMAVVMIGRQIDISVGSQFGVCSVCAGLMAAAGWPWLAVTGLSVVLGAFLGLVNGVLVAGLRLPSIVVTLATMVTWREGLRWLRQGLWVDLPEGVQWFGLRQTAGQWTVLVLTLLVLLAMALAGRHLAGVRFVYALGSNPEAARLAGLRPRLLTLTLFVFLGALAGLAALMNMVQSPQVDPNSGSGLELRAISAAVVGGVAVSGGRGNLWGVILGVLLLACVSPALTYLHVQPHWEKAIQGAVILLAVAGEGLARRRKPGED
jgi:rhamnose transport system permease protein